MFNNPWCKYLSVLLIVIHSLVNKHLFRVFLFINNTGLYILMHAPVLRQKFLQNVFISVEYLVLRVYVFSSLKDNTKMFSKLFYQLY